MGYAQLLRFLLPLVLTLVVVDLGAPVLNGGMARMPGATQTLAAYGLAWGLTAFLTNALAQMRQVALVLADCHGARRRIQWCALSFGALLAGTLALLALAPVGVWVIDDLHAVGEDLGRVVRHALLWLAPVPIVGGLSRLYSGLLLRVRP